MSLEFGAVELTGDWVKPTSRRLRERVARDERRADAFPDPDTCRNSRFNPLPLRDQPSHDVDALAAGLRVARRAAVELILPLLAGVVEPLATLSPRNHA